MEWKMPDLGEGVQEGEIVKWLVKEGDKISHDQHLVEIMTDKATMEIPSPRDGILEKILVKEGEIAKVGQAMAEIATEGTKDQGPGTRDQKKEEREPGVIARGEAPKQSLVEKRDDKREIASRPAAARNDKETEVKATKALASPMIRQMAREMHVDLDAVKGSGAGGKITKSDVQAYVRRGSTSSPRAGVEGSPRAVSTTARPEPVEGPKLPSFGEEERIPLKGLRRKIAEHMVLSRKTAAHFTHVDEADFTELMALRDEAKKSAQAAGVKLTYLPYIIKAVIHGLKKFPMMNSSLDEGSGEIVLKKYFNIGVAVATEEGLIVPVVKNADQLSIIAIAKEISRLSDAARARKISLEDLKGGTFTITNIGSIGGVFSAPVVNYPEVAIMGLHKIKPTPVAKEGEVVIRNMMFISISGDHRVVDGAEVAAFLKEVIACIEHPGELYVEI
ncbi:MAG: dihydrolipoamide acetyltransferase family protein [Deltaproteobacteria bacterium]|nr:dihydrolipoamide acetyltransferase family protein [Deltaproteobacteria bacterium]MDZ4224781.1 dihydrolipoamide acetyltransferase family protein [bacterium]